MKVELDIDFNLKKFENFKEGDCFIFEDRAYIKTTNSHHAVCLNDGFLAEFSYNDLVEPVNLVAHMEKNKESKLDE